MNRIVYTWFTVNGKPPFVIVILLLNKSFGIKSDTYYEQILIWLDNESDDDILIKSAGLFVGGDRKLLIWNEIVLPAGMSLANIFDTVTLF